MGYVLALSSAFFFALSNLCFRRGLKNQGAGTDKQVGLLISILINNLANLFALGLLFLLKPLPSIDTRGIKFFAAAGILASFSGRFLLFSSIERIGAARATSLKITAPLFALVTGIIFLQEIPNIPSITGMGAILTGVFFVSREAQKNLGRQDDSSNSVHFNTKHISVGLFLGILAGLSFGAGNVLRKMGVMHYSEPVVGVAIGSFAALIIVILHLIKEKKVPSLSSLFRKDLMGTFIPGGFMTSLALYFFFYSLQHIPVAVANSIELTEPMFIFLISYFFLQNEEVITLKVVLSYVTIMVGVIVIVLC